MTTTELKKLAEIKRYEPGLGMRLKPDNGEWVRYSDHLAAITALARHEEAAPQEGKMPKYTPERVTGGWTVHRDEKPMLILSSPLTEAEANAFCDLLNAEFGALQSVSPSTNNRCGACQRGDHADCSGWCFCDHSAPQDGETKP